MGGRKFAVILGFIILFAVIFGIYWICVSFDFSAYIIIFLLAGLLLAGGGMELLLAKSVPIPDRIELKGADYPKPKLYNFWGTGTMLRTPFINPYIQYRFLTLLYMPLIPFKCYSAKEVKKNEVEVSAWGPIVEKETQRFSTVYNYYIGYGTAKWDILEVLAIYLFGWSFGMMALGVVFYLGDTYS